MKQLYVLIIFMVSVACENNKTKELPVTTIAELNNITVSKRQFEGENMALGTLVEHNFNTSVKANGMIEVPAHNQSNVSTFVGGYITNTPLLIGDAVKKGQFLVSLENTDYVELQQDYLEIGEQLRYLEAEFTRQKTLYDENITSQKNFLKAESDYKSSLAHYNGLKKKLQMMNINPENVAKGIISSSINLYAPIDGYISKINVSNGSYVSPSDVILEIVDTGHIHLELSVFEKDVLKIKKDQAIAFKIPEASNRVFTAKVHLVGHAIDANTRRVTVHAHIDDDNGTEFLVGMFAEAEIIVDSVKALALPKSAINQINGEYIALVLDKETPDAFHFTKVKLDIGLQTEDAVEILNTQTFKDKKIVVNGTYMLLNETEGDGPAY